MPIFSLPTARNQDGMLCCNIPVVTEPPAQREGETLESKTSPVLEAYRESDRVDFVKPGGAGGSTEVSLAVTSYMNFLCPITSSRACSRAISSHLVSLAEQVSDLVDAWFRFPIF